MCGIAGLWAYGQRPIESNSLKRFTDSMTHRGPDASGIFLDDDLGLGHRRLSIIDLAHSVQPMHSPCGLSIVYNGELYNFRELRTELQKAGQTFQTQGDTEVILAAYRVWGTNCLQHFRGMFAFAIWDSKRRELFLARDRFGIKPLAIAQFQDQLAFASEIEAFRSVKSQELKLRPEMLDLYLYYGYIPAPNTIYQNVHKLPPAHFCLIRNPAAPLQFQRYWEYRFEIDHRLDHGAWGEQLQAEVSEAVKCHLVSDVAVGGFLSGGIDSSTVVAYMSDHATAAVRAYTIGFGNPEFDERQITRESAKLVPMDYHEEQLELDIFDTLDLLVSRYGEPFADSSALCTYRVTELAARDVKVMLSGDGGDEIFGGYSHYAWMLRQFLPNFSLSQQLRLGTTDTLRHFGYLSPRLTLIEGWKGRNAYFNADSRRKLWHTEFDTLPDHTENFLQNRFASLKKARKDNLLDMIQSLDIHDYLPYNNLHKVDIASMCHGLEVRVPLLDHKLAEFAAKIPASERLQPLAQDRAPTAAMHGYVTKFPLRVTAESKFRKGFFDRKKMGFAIPISEWLASDAFFPKLSEVLTSSSSRLLQYFQRDRIQAVLDDHKTTRRHGLQLWNLLFLAKWLEHAKL
jgi:asparagine synthase (glutamine-hydrolysing)